MKNKELDERSQPIDNRSPVVLTRVFAVWLNYFIFDMCQILGICYYFIFDNYQISRKDWP